MDRIGKNQANIFRAVYAASSPTTGASEASITSDLGLSSKVVQKALWALLEKGLVRRDSRGWSADDYAARRVGVIPAW